jgi:succinate dehydrogenase / fumarate reductase cytochrome b subunit
MPDREERVLRRTLAWFDIGRRKMGAWAFALNRLTGLGLMLYLMLHLAVLTLLFLGEEQWDAFITLAKHPLMLALDVVLIFGILYHGLNGLRVALVGMGIAVRSQKALFWGLMTLGVLLLAVGSWLVFAI